MEILNADLEKLVKDFRSGDESAFPKIYQATHRQLFFVILPIIRDKSLAEDIIQDTYLVFLKKIDEYKQKNLLAYLITIAKNRAINEYNRRKKVSKVEDFSDFSYFDHVEFKAETKELVFLALEELELEEKNIFLLHVLEDLTFKEIAYIVDKPQGTVGWLYSKAVKKMKRRLENEI